MQFLHRTWAEISKSAIINNLNEIKSRAGGAGIMAVVKANAYGHGVDITAPILEQYGADRFAVSNIEEALSLREYGIKKPILILGYTPVEYVKSLVDNDISQCVYSIDYADKLSDMAVSKNVTVKAHIKFDTGMARIGFDLRNDETSGISEAISAAKMPGLSAEGVFTHFSSADSDSSENIEFTKKQFDRFQKGVQSLKDAGIDLKYVHCDNSAAVCRGKYTCDIVRPGIILYGLSPDKEFDTDLNLVPVMELKSVVSLVKTIKKGDVVSYGRTYKAKKDMKIATVAAGYADGYPRKLSNKGEVIIKGKRAKIVGRICMDQFMIDVSDIDGVTMGDEVILFGKELLVDEIADMCDTINYEIVSLITPRVPRVLTD